MRERHADCHPRESAPRGAADEDEQHEMRHRGHEVDQARNKRVDVRATDRRGDRQQQRDDRGRHRRHETDRKRGRESGGGTCEHIPTKLIRAKGMLERGRKHLLRKIGDTRDVVDQTAANHDTGEHYEAEQACAQEARAIIAPSPWGMQHTTGP